MKNLLLILYLVFSLLSATAQTFRINEVMSSNGGVLTDADGDTPDWIEFYNAGATSVNLKGYGLSDKKALPFQWIFPDFTVRPGEYLLVFASGKDRKDTPVNWDTIISSGDEWKYLVPSSEPVTNWRGSTFDDSNWQSGNSGFGFGDNDDATLVNVGKSIFLRKKFTIENPALVVKLLLHMDYDDGFVAYLNGVEIARAQMLGKGEFPRFDEEASGNHEALIYQGLSPEQFAIDNPASLLKSGENILAIQVHNFNITSSDLSAIPFLSVGTAGRPVNPRIIDILHLAKSDFHTNFKIDAGGESVYLTSSSSVLVDSVKLGALAVNASYGRTVKNPTDWAVFTASTPGKENSGSGFSVEKTPLPVFSEPGRIISTAVKISLSSPDKNDTIYYTLDGSEPTLKSFIYSGSITIVSSTVVRARIFKAGMLPGQIVTNSYLNYGLGRLPIVSISMNPSDLWDYNTGIYVKGPNAESVSPYKGANFWMDWEKACHFELFEQLGGRVIDVDAGTRIYGNYSRANPQKSMAFYCRKEYGTEFMKYKIFEERPFDEFKDLVLRNSGNDWNYTMFRDGLVTGSTLKLNVDQQAFRPSIVFLNGEYWGILNIREKINEHFIAANHNVEAEDVILLEGNGSPITGSADDWWKMFNYIEQNSLSSQTNYDQVVAQIDLDNYLNYVITQIFYSNHDWPGNNIKYWKTSAPGSRWRWIIFDTDYSLGIYYGSAAYNSLADATATDGPFWPNPPWSTLMLRRLLENTGFRNQFVNRFADLMNSTFSSDQINRAIDEKQELIQNEISRHLMKWNGGTQNDWLTRIQQMRSFVSARPTNVFSHIRQQFEFQATQVMTVRADSLMGSVKLNSLALRNYPWKGTYFPDVPVTLTAIPKAGFRFVKWEGVVNNSSSATITVVPQLNLGLKAVFENDGSHYEDVLINEISFNNEASDDPGDWIEIYNKGNFDIDISGWKITDADPNHQFIFAANTWLKANEYMVVANDLTKMKAIFGSMKHLEGPFGFGLGNTVDAVRLYSRANQLIDEVNYSNSEPWPSYAFNELWSLELINPAKDNSSPLSWVLSEKNGTPGMRNSTAIPDKIDELQMSNASNELLQNYPNPFSQGTYIEFKLNKVGKYRISILDINGRAIRNMIGDDQVSTIHTVYWDGNDESGKQVANGVYFYRLEAADFSEMKRMVKL